MPLGQFQPVLRIALSGRVGQDQRPARPENAVDVEDGEIETERGQRQHPVVGVDAEAVDDVVDGGAGGAVLDLDALRLPGGAGGEDDVSGVIRVGSRWRWCWFGDSLS